MWSSFLYKEMYILLEKSTASLALNLVYKHSSWIKHFCDVTNGCEAFCFCAPAGKSWGNPCPACQVWTLTELKGDPDTAPYGFKSHLCWLLTGCPFPSAHEVSIAAVQNPLPLRQDSSGLEFPPWLLWQGHQVLFAVVVLDNDWRFQMAKGKGPSCVSWRGGGEGKADMVHVDSFIDEERRGRGEV